MGNTKNLKNNLIKLDNIIDFYYVQSIENLTEEREWSEGVVDAVLVANRLERIGDILAKTGSRYIFIEEGRRVWIK